MLLLESERLLGYCNALDCFSIPVHIPLGPIHSLELHICLLILLAQDINAQRLRAIEDILLQILPACTDCHIDYHKSAARDGVCQC